MLFEHSVFFLRRQFYDRLLCYAKSEPLLRFFFISSPWERGKFLHGSVYVVGREPCFASTRRLDAHFVCSVWNSRKHSNNRLLNYAKPEPLLRFFVLSPWERVKLFFGGGVGVVAENRVLCVSIFFKKDSLLFKKITFYGVDKKYEA